MPNVTTGVEMGQAARIWSLPDADIGGAFVRRGFTRFTKDSSPGGQYLKAGTKLSADEVRSIPMVNRRALSVSGALDIYPVAPGVPAADFDRYVIHRGGGHYDVIAGRKLNDEPLTKADAEALAAAA
jgi:hypothetical protein